MRTMKTPEMEVVRFNEADIIVASGLQPGATIRMDMGGSAPKNAVVTYNNRSYSMAGYTNYSAYENDLAGTIGTKPLSAKMKGVSPAADDRNLTLSALLQEEFNGHIKSPGRWTQDFTYDSANNQFIASVHYDYTN